MKFTIVALLVASASAYTPNDIGFKVEGETCTLEAPNCSTATNFCVQRTVDKVSSASDTDYKKALAADPELTAGTVSFGCYPTADADTLVASSGAQDSATRVTATYVKIDRLPEDDTPVVDDEKKEAAMHLTFGAATAAALLTLTF